ncbi:ABC transporter substrate-binding protein [Micrococcales bacterium 31B]|nr:ABC transporter substrate-binding protein [Micrococcales bacterium 31B]
MSTAFTRRTLGLSLALGAAGLATACQASSPADGASAGAWTFTDDQARAITLPSRPTRIAGYSDSMLALMDFGITPVALFDRMAPEENSQMKGHDLGATKIVGTTYGEINIEALAATKPELIVTTIYLDDTASIGAASANEVPFGIKDAAQLKQLQAIAPVIALAMTGTGTEVIDRFNALATSLGVDCTASPVAEGKLAFDTAKDELTAAAQSGLVVLPTAPIEGDGIYVASAPADPQLSMFATFGVTFAAVEPDEDFWDHISLEQADLYPADVIITSETNAQPLEDFIQEPTVAQLPAARAKQVFTWRNAPLTYAAQARVMSELAGWLAQSKKVI